MLPTGPSWHWLHHRGDGSQFWREGWEAVVLEKDFNAEDAEGGTERTQRTADCKPQLEMILEKLLASWEGRTAG